MPAPSSPHRSSIDAPGETSLRRSPPRRKGRGIRGDRRSARQLAGERARPLFHRSPTAAPSVAKNRERESLTFRLSRGSLPHGRFLRPPLSVGLAEAVERRELCPFPA